MDKYIKILIMLLVTVFLSNDIAVAETPYLTEQAVILPNSYLSYIKQSSSALAIPSVAIQTTGYFTQLQSYQQALQNMDSYMMLNKKERAELRENSKNTEPIPVPITGGKTSNYHKMQFVDEDRGLWVRPYAGFEKVQLKNGPEVGNNSYGVYTGVDTEMFEFGNGWNGNVGLYAAYNGSHQTYDGIGIYMNGGTFGSVGTVYKGNYFAGVTVNVSAHGGHASSSQYGDYDIGVLASGVGAKTGYNIELSDGSVIVQPNMAMSYTFVDTFDYTTSSGYKVSSKYLNAFQLEPGVRLIWNLKSGWQPYAAVSMAWNLIDDTNVKISTYQLPNVSVKPYVKYGVGIRKRWNDRFAMSEQTFLYNGGRSGVGLNLDCKWSVGKKRI